MLGQHTLNLVSNCVGNVSPPDDLSVPSSRLMNWLMVTLTVEHAMANIGSMGEGCHANKFDIHNSIWRHVGLVLQVCGAPATDSDCLSLRRPLRERQFGELNALGITILLLLLLLMLLPGNDCGHSCAIFEADIVDVS